MNNSNGKSLPVAGQAPNKAPEFMPVIILTEVVCQKCEKGAQFDGVVICRTIGELQARAKVEHGLFSSAIVPCDNDALIISYNTALISTALLDSLAAQIIKP